AFALADCSGARLLLRRRRALHVGLQRLDEIRARRLDVPAGTGFYRGEHRSERMDETEEQSRSYPSCEADLFEAYLRILERARDLQRAPQRQYAHVLGQRRDREIERLVLQIDGALAAEIGIVGIDDDGFARHDAVFRVERHRSTAQLHFPVPAYQEADYFAEVRPPQLEVQIAAFP